MRKLMVVLLMLGMSTGALGLVVGNPDQRPSLTLFGGIQTSEGFWDAEGAYAQDIESETEHIGLTLKIPVNKDVTFFASGARGKTVNKWLEDYNYYGSETEQTGWNFNGGITFYFGSD